MRFRIAISISAQSQNVHTIFIHRSGNEWLFIKRCHSIDTWKVWGRSRHTCAPFEFSPSPDFLLCLCFKPIPFVWLIYGEARAVPSVRDRDHGESIRCRSCEMIRWNLYSLERIFPSFSFSNALKTDGTVVASVERNYKGEARGDISERSVNLLLECKNGKYHVYMWYKFLNFIWNDTRAVHAFFLTFLLGFMKDVR